MLFLNEILAESDQPVELIRQIPTHYIWLGVIIVVGFFMLRSTWRRVSRANSYGRMSVEEKVKSQLGPRNPMIDHANEYMATLADLSRQINGQIDTRIGRLELLLEQTDRAIERLEAAKNNMTEPALTASTPPPATSAPPVEPEETDCEPDPLPAIQFDYDRLSPEARSVIQLAEQGVPLIDIARKLERPVGEVELILSLTGRKRP